MKKAAIFLAVISLLFTFTGCESPQAEEESGTVQYKKITAAQAYADIAADSSIIILDVRTDEEFAELRIPGSILIPDYETKDTVEQILPDKSAKIYIYCRSGRRSALAAKEMIALGYTDVADFGGIIDWPYETVSG